jgi:hypothetical protein
VVYAPGFSFQKDARDPKTPHSCFASLSFT